MRRLCTVTKRRTGNMRDCRARQHKHTKGSSPFIVLNFIVSFGTVCVVTLCQSRQPMAIRRQMKLASTHTFTQHTWTWACMSLRSKRAHSFLSVAGSLAHFASVLFPRSIFFSLNFIPFAGSHCRVAVPQKVAKWKRQIKFI